MKLARIIRAASAAYPPILSAWDETAERPIDRPEGNRLAWFMVTELSFTYDASASDKEQLMIASNTLREARIALESTSWRLSEVWVETVGLEPQYLDGLPDLEFLRDSP